MKHTSLKSTICFALLLLCCCTLAAQNNKGKNSKQRKSNNTARVEKTTVTDTAGLSAANAWADKQMKHLSLEEKVGQLMFVRVPTSFTKKTKREFEKNFSSHNVGGVCFFKGTASNQLALTKRYQQLSDIPLMVTIDGEWGLGSILLPIP